MSTSPDAATSRTPKLYTVTMTVDLSDPSWQDPNLAPDLLTALETWLQLMSDTTETGIGEVTLHSVSPETH